MTTRGRYPSELPSFEGCDAFEGLLQGTNSCRKMSRDMSDLADKWMSELRVDYFQVQKF